MNPHAIAVVLTAAILAACSSTGSFDYDDSDVVLDRLVKVTNASAGLVYVDPDVDFGAYSKILLAPLDSSSAEIKQPNQTGTTVGAKPFILTDEDQARLAEAYAEIFSRELAETGDYEIVTERGSGVLVIAAALTEVAPVAPKDDDRSRSTGRNQVYTEGAGSMSIAFAFADSQSNEMLAIVKDSRSGSPTWGLNNAVTNTRDVRTIFARWARMIRARLDIAHGF